MVDSHKQHNQEKLEGAIGDQEMCGVLNINLCGPGYQALVLSHLDYCPAVWTSAAKKDLRKLQLVQNRTEGQARLALQCRNRSNILHMHNADLGSW